MGWRIGNSENVKIWSDKWLPSTTTYKVVSPRRVLDDEAQVCKLLDTLTQWWNAELIDSVFLPKDEDVIKKIPLIPSPTGDTLIWHEITNGKFSVKIDYKLALLEKI